MDIPCTQCRMDEGTSVNLWMWCKVMPLAYAKFHWQRENPVKAFERWNSVSSPVQIQSVTGVQRGRVIAISNQIKWVDEVVVPSVIIYCRTMTLRDIYISLKYYFLNVYGNVIRNFPLLKDWLLFGFFLMVFAIFVCLLGKWWKCHLGLLARNNGVTFWFWLQMFPWKSQSFHNMAFVRNSRFDGDIALSTHMLDKFGK